MLTFIVFLFRVSTSDADFCMRLCVLCHVRLIQYRLSSPLFRIMTTRRSNHAGHWALRAFCRDHSLPMHNKTRKRANCGHTFWEVLCRFDSISIYRVPSIYRGSSDAIWRYRSGSTLAQVMACCLMAPIYYLIQCWLLSSKVSVVFTWDYFTFTASGQATGPYNEFEKLYFWTHCHFSS